MRRPYSKGPGTRQPLYTGVGEGAGRRPCRDVRALDSAARLEETGGSLSMMDG